MDLMYLQAQQYKYRVIKLDNYQKTAYHKRHFVLNRCEEWVCHHLQNEACELSCLAMRKTELRGPAVAVGACQPNNAYYLVASIFNSVYAYNLLMIDIII